MVRILVAGMLLVAALAGCAGDDGSAAAGPDALPSGALAGVVVDEAIRPVSGARVSIPLLPDVAPGLSGDDGLFRLDGVRPGAAVLLVERAGFLAATVHVAVPDGEPAGLVRVQLQATEEDRPYIVQESFDGFMSCGLGSAVVFGLTAPCEQLAGAALDVMCRGQDPVPATGVCLSGTSPYYVSQARGNLTMAQSELVWEPSLAGTELMLVQWAMAPDGQLITGIGSAAGPPFLVSRLGAAVLDEHQIGGTNLLALYVSVASTAEANVVLQQSYRAIHTTAYFFELEEGWSFVRDGAPLVPPVCTVCLD